MLVAFTANDHATNFARENEGLLDANGELAALVVGGTDLLMYLPEGVGVVFNPDSAQESIMPPRLVAEVKRLLR